MLYSRLDLVVLGERLFGLRQSRLYGEGGWGGGVGGRRCGQIQSCGWSRRAVLANAPLNSPVRDRAANERRMRIRGTSGRGREGGAREWRTEWGDDRIDRLKAGERRESGSGRSGVVVGRRGKACDLCGRVPTHHVSMGGRRCSVPLWATRRRRPCPSHGYDPPSRADRSGPKVT